MNWLTHPIFNSAYVAQYLYGENNASTRSQLSKKIRGERPWQTWELCKLEEVRQQLLENLRILSLKAPPNMTSGQLIDALKAGKTLFRDFSTISGDIQTLYYIDGYFYCQGWGSTLGLPQSRLEHIVKYPEEWKIKQ